MQEDKKTGSTIAGTIRMCMYMLCGAAQNRDKQPKFLENCAQDSIYIRLTRLIDAGRLNDAENVMYDELDPSNDEDYYTMLCVYDYMNDLDDDFIKQCGFSREEIEDGVREITYLNRKDDGLLNLF